MYFPVRGLNKHPGERTIVDDHKIFQENRLAPAISLAFDSEKMKFLQSNSQEYPRYDVITQKILFFSHSGCVFRHARRVTDSLV
jgi:hypothetical protein